MKFEVNVVNFNNEDVIATSCNKAVVELDFSKDVNKEQVVKGLLVEGLNDGDFVKLGKSTYQIKDGGKVDNFPAGYANDDTYDGIYHLVGNTYEYCEDGHNKNR